MNAKADVYHQYLYIIFVVSLYWIVSILMVFLNKILLSSDKIHLNAPLFITWFQCITCVGICRLLKGLSNVCPRYFYFPEGNPFSYKIVKTE
ncbi:PREDICTED: GDP-fucose transporter 1 isoform X2 [Ceratosolen solmsi marchali]|uniref:GDP-fucose transporter 1 isoform X2 n=1 Tax=Ceratosolen solmsi marchali TaxID=326594 RepID=A0AAJ6YGB4_9HYME|nr:PREDICTED: GDP-fucose transporter 1 isoform X2 [Ceratosolen solmsi marchali]